MPFGLRGKLYEVLRNLARSLVQLDLFVQLTAQRAGLGIATTEDRSTRRFHRPAEQPLSPSQRGRTRAPKGLRAWLAGLRAVSITISSE